MRQTWTQYYVWIAAALLSGACSRTTEKNLAELKSSVEQLGTRLDDLDGSLQTLQDQVTLLETAPRYETAIFDPVAAEGFSPVHTSVGVFAVSIQDVQPFADGTRVRLHVGNLTGATVGGVRIKAKWGESRPKDSKKVLPWLRSLQEKEIPIIRELKPGWWNNVMLPLPGTPPGRLGHLELEMETGQISLASPR